MKVFRFTDPTSREQPRCMPVPVNRHCAIVPRHSRKNNEDRLDDESREGETDVGAHRM